MSTTTSAHEHRPRAEYHHQDLRRCRSWCSRFSSTGRTSSISPANRIIVIVWLRQFSNHLSKPDCTQHAPSAKALYRLPKVSHQNFNYVSELGMERDLVKFFHLRSLERSIHWISPSEPNRNHSEVIYDRFIVIFKNRRSCKLASCSPKISRFCW